MKALRAQTMEHLAKRESELTEELFRLRFRRGAGQLQNTARLGQVHRELARIKTVQHEKRRTI